jgi:hypothetical protein
LKFKYVVKTCVSLVTVWMHNEMTSTSFMKQLINLLVSNEYLKKIIWQFVLYGNFYRRFWKSLTWLMICCWFLCFEFWDSKFRDFNIKIQEFSKVKQFRAWSNCIYVQTGLALYWWQRLITFNASRLNVKCDTKWIAYTVNSASTRLKMVGKMHFWYGLCISEMQGSKVLLE